MGSALSRMPQSASGARTALDPSFIAGPARTHMCVNMLIAATSEVGLGASRLVVGAAAPEWLAAGAR